MEVKMAKVKSLETVPSNYRTVSYGDHHHVVVDKTSGATLGNVYMFTLAGQRRFQAFPLGMPFAVTSFESFTAACGYVAFVGPSPLVKNS